MNRFLLIVLVSSFVMLMGFQSQAQITIDSSGIIIDSTIVSNPWGEGGRDYPVVRGAPAKGPIGGPGLNSGCPNEKPNSSCRLLSDCSWLCAALPINNVLVSSDFNNNVYELSVGPNPFNSELNFNSNKQSLVSIYSLSGQKVYQKNILGSYNINTSSLKSGMYILEIKDDIALYRVKILKIE